MTLAEKYKDSKPIGVYGMCNFGGIEILDVLSDEELIACFNFSNGRQSIRKHRIYNIDGKPFIIKMGVRYYLDDIMKVM